MCAKAHIRLVRKNLLVQKTNGGERLPLKEIFSTLKCIQPSERIQTVQFWKVFIFLVCNSIYSKTCVNGHSQKRKSVFKTN